MPPRKTMHTQTYGVPFRLKFYSLCSNSKAFMASFEGEFRGMGVRRLLTWDRPQTTTTTTATSAGQKALPELLLWEYNANNSRSIFIGFVCTRPQRHARASLCEWRGGEKRMREGAEGFQGPNVNYLTLENMMKMWIQFQVWKNKEQSIYKTLPVINWTRNFSIGSLTLQQLLHCP